MVSQRDNLPIAGPPLSEAGECTAFDGKKSPVAQINLSSIKQIPVDKKAGYKIVKLIFFVR